MNVFLLFLSALVITATSVVAIVSLLRGRAALARRAGAVAVSASLLYAGALVVVNAGSAPVLLGPGEREAFCGAYLDCHIGLAVTDAVPAEVAGRAVQVVTVRLSSDAVRATLSPPPLTLRVVAEDGRAFERDRWAEVALGLDAELNAPLAAGSSRTTRVAFALPEEAREPRLRAELDDPIWRSIEGLVIGDPDGLFHPPVDHALEVSGPRMAARVGGER